MENKQVMVLQNVPTKKTEIAEAAQAAIAAVTEGEVSAVDAYIKLKAMKQMLDEIEKGIAKAFYFEVGNTIDCKKDHPLGATLTETVTATKFDYSSNPEWAALNGAIENAKVDLKAIEKKMKNNGEARAISGGDCIISVKLGE